MQSMQEMHNLFRLLSNLTVPPPKNRVGRFHARIFLMQRPIPRGVRLKAHAGSPLMQSAPHWTTTASGQYADQILLAMLVNNTKKKNIFQQNNLIFGIDHDQKQKGGLCFLMRFVCSWQSFSGTRSATFPLSDSHCNLSFMALSCVFSRHMKKS